MLKLVIGNKNYSSWSMRPWLALRANNIAFEEVFIPLYTDDRPTRTGSWLFSRSGKVPALIDGDVTIWDSLAIIEYLAEKFPEARLWPEDRARARACALDFGGNAFGLHGAAQRMRHEPASAGRRRSRCRTMRAPMSRASRKSGPNAASGTEERAVPVRRLRRRGRHVRAGGASVPHLCDRGRGEARPIWIR